MRIARRTALAGALGTTALLGLPAWAKRSQSKPNILFIMADDLGYADLSAYGRRDYQTPHIDRLAAQGMMFTHAYANSSVCTPTRVALATGRYQYRLPIGLQEPHSIQDVGLPPEQPTIASVLRQAGYRTSLIGKWHMGALPKYGPLQSGYDEFWGVRGGGVDYFTHGLNGNADLWDGDTAIEDSGYLTDLLADRTIQTLEQRKGYAKPFMISLHFTAPHWPWEGNDAAGRAESSRLAQSKAPQAALHYDGGTLATYAAIMKSLDDNVGRILAKLAELGLDRNTIVIFTSDNGGERFSDTWPFTGKKTELLEGGIRVPTIVRWPGHVKPGTTSAVPIMSMDWLPTFAAIADAKIPSAAAPDGVDISPLLAGSALADRTLFWRYKNRDQRAVRRGDFKYLSIGGNEFLFDVVNDPLERGNLKARRPALFEEMKAAWTEWNRALLNDPNAPSAANMPARWADHMK